MGQYPIIATTNEIWAINPANKQRLKLAHVNAGILGLYACDRGIYHAAVTLSENSKLVQEGSKRVQREFDYNYVTIYDTISGNSACTAFPPGQDRMPLEDRMMEIEFAFSRKGEALNF